MFGAPWEMNYGLSWCWFARGGTGGIYLSCPRFQSLCLHLSQHDMVWKLPVCLLMMINVHSHVSNLGSLQESRGRLPGATWGGSWSYKFCTSPAWVDASSMSVSSPQSVGPSWVSGTRSGVGAEGGPPPGRLVVVPFGQCLAGVTGRVTPCPFFPAPWSGRPTTSYISSAAGACHLSEDSCQHLVQLPPQTQ